MACATTSTRTDEIFNNLNITLIKQLCSKTIFHYIHEYKSQELTTKTHSSNTKSHGQKHIQHFITKQHLDKKLHIPTMKSNSSS